MAHTKIIRPAMTAIAAVIAFSSAPVVAQSADVPVDQTATPVIESTPIPVAVDPIAPDASPTIAAEPVARTKVATPRKAAATRPTVTRARPAAPAPTVARAAAPAAAISAPVAEAPAVASLPIAAPAAAAPVAQAPATESTIAVLPTVALGALALLVLLGGALAIRTRRRRRAEEAETTEWQQDVEAPSVAEADLAMTAEPEFAPAEPAVAAFAAEPNTASETDFAEHQTDLPEGFDISRFGPNVQDAYRGPTEDNPALSLKQRLRRAHGMDQQERKLADEVEAVTGEPVLDESEAQDQAETPAVGSTSGGFILARGDMKPNESTVRYGNTPVKTPPTNKVS